MRLLKLTILIASMLFVIAPAHANTMTFEIDAYLFGIDFDGGFVNEFQEGIGSATFEAPAPDGLALLVDFDIEILSAVFTEQDDLNFPGAPWATIEDGVLVGIAFSGFNDAGAYLTIDETFAFSVHWNPTGHIVSGVLGFRPVDTNVSAATGVPEPSAGLVFAIGFIAVSPWLRRRGSAA